MYFDINAYEGKYVMHCKTEEEAKNFCQYLNSVGRTWNNKRSYLTDNHWNMYKDKMVYYFNSGEYSSVNYAKNSGYTILEWEDFMKQTFTKADLKTGDVILRRNGDVEIFNSELQMFIRKAGWTDFKDIDDDLIATQGGKDWDIVSVRRPIKKHDCMFDAFEYKRGTLIYERKEVEEMTLEQVCKLLGKEIKIIK